MMQAERTVLTDALWARIEDMLPGKATDPGGTAVDHRPFREAVLWRTRTGSPWRDLPAHFSHGNSLCKRCRRWARAGVCERVCHALSDEFNFEYVFIDGTIVPAHAKAAGAKGTRRQGSGRSRGGLSRQIVAVTDARGYLVRFVILPGQAHDLAEVPALREDLPFPALSGDRALDADGLIAEVKGRGAAPVMPAPRHRTEPREHDQEMYPGRHRSANCCARIQAFRTVATRYDQTDVSFAAAIHQAATPAA